ncbi:Arginine--tRNA ligase [uncultured spirochete]|jgi:arginyl-tRNA synthetase|uniref:Arginine--tRNA ligase n=1 Tax=uncultured spirochete TaxID=156406 RepID=A0A3P3XGT3_9SPIR|nr:arginine--tRNA ligase [Rectinema subterraneum]SLM10101.1 Arginine--tRNA ligase [uncultured spirochete]
MEHYIDQWKTIIAAHLRTIADKKGIVDFSLTLNDIIAEKPPKPELGDIGFPMFAFAKQFRLSPAQIASEVAQSEQLLKDENEKRDWPGNLKAVGPYLNVYLERTRAVTFLLSNAANPDWGSSAVFSGRKVMIEFSCPNTNKPLHLGHLRNNVLGESLSRIMKAAGAEVKKVNLINDRGVHICKSMLAYLAYGEGRTPEDEGLKSDHFVGKYYVLFNKLKEEDPQAEQKAQELLQKWEAGDPEVIALWKKMNDWAVDGIMETYRRQQVSFDEYHFEHETYKLGKKEVLEGLERGVFYRGEDGAIWIDLEDLGLGKKVLLRKDGTSIYITQDIGTAIMRHESWPFDQLIYVVASEQQYHFKVLFEVLKRLGYDWASSLYHLSYGLVNLPTGRMKTREGTVVDADDLIDELARLAAVEIAEKGRADAVGDIQSVAGQIALGALHYYLLQISPAKDMLYNPEQSLSFTGDTGPYIQYMGARASSILRKHDQGEGNAAQGIPKANLLSSDADWPLVRTLMELPSIIEESAKGKDPSILAGYAHAVASEFSAWYRDNPVLINEDPNLSASRLALVRAVKSVLMRASELLCVPFLEAM